MSKARLESKTKLEGLSTDEVVSELIGQIRELMREHCNPNELVSLSGVLSNYEAIRRSELTEGEVLHHYNLLTGIIGFWFSGKVDAQKVTRELYLARIRNVNRKADPISEELFQSADRYWKWSVEDVQKKIKWNEKADKNPSIPYQKFPRKELLGLSYVEALREANRFGRFFTVQEFDIKEIDLQNAYKNWRKKKARKDSLKVKPKR